MADISKESEGVSPENDDDSVLETAKTRIKLAEEATQDERRLALEDLEFRSGKHWPDAIQSERNQDGRPCLVINRIPQFIQQVTNDQRQNRPSIKVHPVDDKGDPETAKAIQGLVRHIEYNSNADVAYDTAFDSAATGGFGYFRVITDYADPMSFEQEILIKRIRNPFSVFFDPHSQEPDGSDAQWAAIVEDISADEYRARYPKSKLAQRGEWEVVGNAQPDWMPDGSARVVEYFYEDVHEKEICLLSDGTTVLAEELPSLLPPEVQVVRRRRASVPVIKWCKLNAVETLDATEWPGKFIPIVPVYGNELYIDGKRILEGVVRNAKDSQRMYNYWASAETEAIALAPRAPFIMAEGQDEGHEAEWATANRRNYSTLKYKPTSASGTLIGPPQRNAFEPAVQAISQARMLAADDMKATTGIYDSALGAKSNETSGIAIQRRNVQAQTSNFHFIDNLTRSLRHTGRILIDLIPRIYDTARTARIIGEDGEQDVVKFNAPFVKDGQELLYDLKAGKYDVTVDVGPSFASKRQEAAASMLELTRNVPQLVQIAGDLLVKNMDWPGATEIAERLKKTLPPGLADDPSKSKDIPPEVQNQMSQMGQMIDQLTAKLNEAQDAMEHKRLELESKERIEFKKLEVQLEIKRAELDAKDSLALLSAEISSIEHRIAQLNGGVPIADVTEDDQPQPQSSAPQMMDGGQMPASPMMEPNPIGGESPSTSMEGI